MNGNFGAGAYPTNPSPTFGQITAVGRSALVPVRPALQLLMAARVVAASRRCLALGAVLSVRRRVRGPSRCPPRRRRSASAVAGADEQRGVSLAAARSQRGRDLGRRRDGVDGRLRRASAATAARRSDAPVRVNDVPGDARVSGEQAPRVGVGAGVDVVWVLAAGTGASVIRAAQLAAGGDDVRARHHRARRRPRRARAAGPPLARTRDGAVHVAWLDGRGDGRPRAGARRPRRPHVARSMRQDLFQAVWRPTGRHDEVARRDRRVLLLQDGGRRRPGRRRLRGLAPHLPAEPARHRRRAVDRRRPDVLRRRCASARTAGRSTGCPDDGPSIAVDAAGVLHVVWPTMVAGERPRKGIFYSYSTDGGRTFAPRRRVDDEAGRAAHPQIAAGGRPYRRRLGAGGGVAAARACARSRPRPRLRAGRRTWARSPSSATRPRPIPRSRSRPSPSSRPGPSPPPPDPTSAYTAGGQD